MLYYSRVMQMQKYKAVQKRTIKRLENIGEEKAKLNRMIFILELCRESDEELWKQLILLQLEDLKILKGREGNKIKNEMRRKRRKLKYE